RVQAMNRGSSSGTTGWRNVAPIAARSALGLNGSAVPRSAIVPAAPRACAVRINVPTFPGSCTASITSAAPAPPPPPPLQAMSASVHARGSTTAMIPCGVSVSASDANTRAVACSTGTACRPSPATSAVPPAVRPRPGATTAPRNRRPAGTSVITAVTAQNTVGVRAWEPLPATLVTQQLDALADDLPPQAVKSGMLGSAELVAAVADGIARWRLRNYVLDPVMVATSGDRL